jgi:uncharacterized protein
VTAALKTIRRNSSAQSCCGRLDQRRTPSANNGYDQRSRLMLPDPAHSQSEPRCYALGKTIDGRRLHLTFTLRDDGKLIRVISARDMHRKERAHYEQAS